GTAYKRTVIWKKMPQFIKNWNVTEIHNWTGYVALVLILVHPLLLLFDPSSKFRLIHILVPFNAPQQAWFMALGVLSLYFLLIVIITTQKSIKNRLGFRTWKNLHLVSYLTVLFVCVHGIFMDPELKNRLPDYFDGEKVLCEICFLLLIFFTIIRVRYHYQKGTIIKTDSAQL
ncbi:MAG: ferric reductase-like transmembrane domain-containing protein, partial [Flavisolibacter sp.]